LGIFCSASLVNMNCFSMCLSWQFFISPSNLKTGFLGIIILIGSFFQILKYITPCFPGF
jgi:hypothetical protein